MRIKAHTVKSGKAEGEAIVTSMPFSFLGDYDLASGIGCPGHELAGVSIAGKILVFPTGHGSTAGALIGYYSRLLGTIPKGMICRRSEPVIALNAIMNNIPTVDRLEIDPLEAIKTGDYVKIDADEGFIEIITAK